METVSAAQIHEWCGDKGIWGASGVRDALAKGLLRPRWLKVRITPGTLPAAEKPNRKRTTTY